MKEEKDHIIYTAEDIKRYITGAMSSVEMHAMEMAALDDPLLAEAMEGYELMEQKDWSIELAALKQHFNQEKKDKTPVIPLTKNKTFKWWKAAAAVLVLGTAASTAYLFTNKTKNLTTPELAKSESITSATDAPAAPVQADSADSFATIAATDSNSQLIAQANTATASGSVAFTIPPSTATTTDNVKAVADSNFIYRPSTDTKGLIAMKDDNAVAGGELETTAEKEYKATGNSNYPGNAAAQNNVTVYNNSGYEERAAKTNAELNVVTLDKKAREADNNTFSRSQNTFSGQVLDKDNQPLGYASIKIPHSKKAVLTDANGMFKVTAPDSSLPVVVSSAGFNSQKYNLQNAAALNKIVLEPQLVVTESIVKAENTRAFKRQKAAVDSSLLEEEEEAAPECGWTKYNNYLSNNLRFPEDARQKNIHGEVEVTVKLSKNGDVSQVSVDKPLCAGCDAEAIRLVKEGPKWDMKNTKKKKVKVKVKF